MRIVVAGGGKVGFFLAQTLSRRHRLSLIERDAGRCALLAAELPGVVVVRADASDLGALRAAGAERADVLAAVTGKDEDNLVICQLAKWCCGVGRVVMRASNPKNAEIFSRFDAGAAISGTALIANVVEEQFAAGDIRFLQAFRRGDMELVELAVASGAPAAGCRVRDLGLPRGATLVAVVRGAQVIAPHGDTRIEGGDAVIAITRRAQAARLRAAIAAGPRG